MGDQISEVGYTTAMPRRKEQKVQNGRIVAMEQKIYHERRGSGIVLWQWSALAISWYIVLNATPSCMTQNHAGHK